MRKHLVTIALLCLAALLLVACNRNSTPPEKSSGAATPAQPAAGSTEPVNLPPDSMSAELTNLAGSGATDCGRVPTGHDPKSASECAMKNYSDKKAFYVRYDLPIPDAQMAIATIRTSDGKLVTAQFDSKGWEKAPENGKLIADKKISVQPCPSPETLRVANSGRVTCFPPAQMPAGMGSPHGGGGMTMPPATGANPHGGTGMPMPAPGTPNPHKADTNKSH